MKREASGEKERQEADVPMDPSGASANKARGSSDAAAVAILSRDYAEIAGLMAQLDKEVETFTDNMSKLNGSAPKHAGLTALWEEQAKSTRQELRVNDQSLSTKPKSKQPSRTSKQQKFQDNDSDTEEGADNKNDPLVFM